MCGGKGLQKCDYFAYEGSMYNLIDNLILQILTCPANSASIDQIFSIFGLIHSKHRSSLGNEKHAILQKNSVYVKLLVIND